MTELAQLGGGFEHAMLDLRSGDVTLHGAGRVLPMPRDRMRLADLRVARCVLRMPAGQTYAMRWPYGYAHTLRGPARPTPTAGLVRGHSHDDWHGAVNTLRAHREDGEALLLLLELVDAAVAAGSPLACGWAERAAVILRRHSRRAERELLRWVADEDMTGHAAILRARLG